MTYKIQRKCDFPTTGARHSRQDFLVINLLLEVIVINIIITHHQNQNHHHR